MLVVSGCTAGTVPLPSAVPTPSASPRVSPSIPADGSPLRLLGFTHGPVAYLSVPRSAVITDRVDQPNAVSVVVTRPSAETLTAYFQRALPAAGFRVVAQNPANRTLQFEGHGWEGSFTGSDLASALIARPQ